MFLRLSFLLFSIALCQSEASKAIQLSKNCTIQFASVKGAKDFLAIRDVYIEGLSSFERAARRIIATVSAGASPPRSGVVPRASDEWSAAPAAGGQRSAHVPPQPALVLHASALPAAVCSRVRSRRGATPIRSE